MFRRIEDSLDPDPSFPADLKQLGFFINTLGQIRMIDAPDKAFVFFATNNERVNEVRREAFHACERQEIEKRLSNLGLQPVHLPQYATNKPNGPHVPILAPGAEIIKYRKRVMVLINDASQDLGVLAYRQVGHELGLNGGSVVNFVKEIIKRSSPGTTVEQDEELFKDGFELKNDSTTPALVVLNTGQLLYSHKYDQAMTLQSWSAMPRKSSAHDEIQIHDEENRVPGHRDPKEHVQTVFDEVVFNPERVAADAEVYVIAIESGTDNILSLLDDNFGKYGPRITAMALIDTLIDDSQVKSSELRAFLHERTRQWKFTDLTTDPLHCTALPEDYAAHEENILPSPLPTPNHISWHEDLPKPKPLSLLTKALPHISLSKPSKNHDSVPATPETEETEWNTSPNPLCPRFATGDNSIGECIFTNPSVQSAILSFFSEVAQSPHNYHNPPFTLHPTTFPCETETSLLPTPPSFAAEPTLEQADLSAANVKLASMHEALAAMPANVPELAQGALNLRNRIEKQEAEAKELEKKALKMGGLKKGEAGEARAKKDENWQPKPEGPKVAFAGTMVDKGLLEEVGLLGE